MGAKKSTRKSKAQFMVFDDENNACCGKVFSSFDGALDEAKSHLKCSFDDSGGEYALPYKIVQVVAIVKIKAVETIVDVQKV